MGKINLRLNAILATFAMALICCVCLGYYVMSQTDWNEQQTAEIQMELARSRILQELIQENEAREPSVVQVHEDPPIEPKKLGPSPEELKLLLENMDEYLKRNAFG